MSIHKRDLDVYNENCEKVGNIIKQKFNSALI